MLITIVYLFNNLLIPVPPSAPVVLLATRSPSRPLEPAVRAPSRSRRAELTLIISL
jgi:hypothetical protein